MRSASGPRYSTIALIAAFFVIYVVWGTTFLAIRVAVSEVPPLYAAAVRFLVAGLLLYGFVRWRGAPPPNGAEWRSLLLLALLMFVMDYSALFWAERFVPSGVASVLLATMPLTTIALEMLVFRQQPFRARLLFAVVLGFCGTGVLVWPGRTQHFAVLPCVAILCGAVGWAVGSVLNRSLRLPKSRAVTSGATMLLGGVMLLLLSGIAGELRPWPHVSLRAASALAYLIVFGSIVGFTAFVWLLARLPATLVSSHAYINPVVALALGHFAAGEVVTARMLAGAAVVLLSVVLVLRRPGESQAMSAVAE